MNFNGTQVRYGNRSGIQTSQLISRNAKSVDSIALDRVSENLNRFLSGHSRQNTNHGLKKFRLNDYFTKDLKAKTSSAHHLLCGPLNTKRLTRKTIAGNFDEPTQPVPPLNVNDLYNCQPINVKPPWIGESEPEQPPQINQPKPPPPEPTVASGCFEFNPRFSENFTQGAPDSVVEEETQIDGEVPDPEHQDLRDSCPLYDSSEYEQCSSPNNVTKDTSDDEKSQPQISRYNFFVGRCTDEEFPVVDGNSDSVVMPRKDKHKRSIAVNDDEKRYRFKRLTREEKFRPLITWPNDDAEDEEVFYSVVEYQAPL